MIKDVKHIKDYYNNYYTDKLQSLFEKTLIIQAFKPYENDMRQGKWLSNQMGIKGNEKILECGCGVGGVMKQLKKIHPNIDIQGINISDGQVNMANKILKDFDNCDVSVGNFMKTNYKDNTFDVVYFCESMGYGDFEKTINESVRILKPNGKLYIKEIVTKCDEDKLSKKELDNLNHFIDSWFYNVYDIKTIINKIEKIGGLKLIKNNRFVKPSIHWMNAVRKSELKKIHNAKWSNIPPLRGSDFLYKKN